MSCNFQEILRDSSANSPVISRCPDSGKRQHPTRPINYAERKRVTGDGYFRFPAYSIIPASSQLFRHNTEASMATTNLSYNQMNILRIKGGRGRGVDWHVASQQEHRCRLSSIHPVLWFLLFYFYRHHFPFAPLLFRFIIIYSFTHSPLPLRHLFLRLLFHEFFMVIGHMMAGNRPDLCSDHKQW